MYQTLDRRKDLDRTIEMHLAPLVKRIEALEAGQPQSSKVTDEMVQIACEIYSEVYVDDDKGMGDAMRAALTAALTRPDHNTEGRCICQDQHRRGYCTEPGCPYSSQIRPQGE